MPVLPFLLDKPSMVIRVLEQARYHGAQFIIPMFGVTLRDRQRDHFYLKLGEQLPQLVSRYQQTFGSRYHCQSQQASRLWSILQEYCEKYGIACTMQELRRFDHPAPGGPEQLELF